MRLYHSGEMASILCGAAAVVRPDGDGRVRLLTRVRIERTARLHPDWTVTIEDVRDALASMREHQERQEAMW